MKYTILTLSLIFSSLVFAQDDVGVITFAKGKIDINGQAAKQGSRIHIQDTVTAGEDSKAQIMLVDENVIHINANSQFIVKEHEFDEEENKKFSLFELVYGSIRALVNQRFEKEDQGFQIQTPSTVAGVRGTDFLVDHNKGDGKSEITSFSGEVAAGERGSGRLINNPTKIPPGHFIQAFRARAIALAQRVEAGRFSQLRETTAHPIDKDHKLFRALRLERIKARVERRRDRREGMRNRRRGR